MSDILNLTWEKRNFGDMEKWRAYTNTHSRELIKLCLCSCAAFAMVLGRGEMV